MHAVELLQIIFYFYVIISSLNPNILTFFFIYGDLKGVKHLETKSICCIS